LIQNGLLRGIGWLCGTRPRNGQTADSSRRRQQGIVIVLDCLWQASKGCHGNVFVGCHAIHKGNVFRLRENIVSIGICGV